MKQWRKKGENSEKREKGEKSKKVKSKKGKIKEKTKKRKKKMNKVIKSEKEVKLWKQVVFTTKHCIFIWKTYPSPDFFTQALFVTFRKSHYYH